MQNLFDKTAYAEIMNRMGLLKAESERKWGKMNAAQMMAHCSEAFKIPLTDKKFPRMFISYLFGWLAKKQVTSDKPYKEGLPTAPDFVIKDERNFETEKARLEKCITDFNTLGPDNTCKHPHPFFGSLTKAEWGNAMYKHMDHHLRQFGV